MKPRSKRRRWIKRLLVSVTSLVLAAVVVVAAQPLWAFWALARIEPRIVWRGNVTEPMVALSFDDGPSSAHTPQVLEILARHRAHATFFLIGERALEQPRLVATLRAGGHEIGNHSVSIRSTVNASDAAFVDALLRTERILGIDGSPKLFRPPGGKIRGAQL